jgi:hypothetical protein
MKILDATQSADNSLLQELLYRSILQACCCARAAGGHGAAE